MANIEYWMANTSPADPHDPPFPGFSPYSGSAPYRHKDTSIYMAAAESQMSEDYRHGNPFNNVYWEGSSGSSSARSSPPETYMGDNRYPFVDPGRRQWRPSQKEDGLRRTRLRSNALLNAKQTITREREEVPRRTRQRANALINARQAWIEGEDNCPIKWNENIWDENRQSSNSSIEPEQRRPKHNRHVTFDEKVLEDTARQREGEKNAARIKALNAAESRDFKRVKREKRYGKGRRFIEKIVRAFWWR